MVKITLRQRIIIDRKMEKIKQRDKDIARINQIVESSIGKREFHQILDKASQPINPESDQEQS